MEDPAKASYEFAGFRFDASERVLYRGSQIIPLTPKVADTLWALLDRRGRVVDKNDLLKLVWPDTFVEEGGLARNISILRKVLGDECIETVPKRGYRFVAEVRDGGVPPAEPAPVAVAALRRRRWGKVAVAAGVAALVAAAGYLALKPRLGAGRMAAGSLAVLPLKNVSNDPAQEYFSEGMTDMLATELARNGVRVIAPASTRRVRPGAPLDEIGRQLDAGAVVQGTVLTSGGRVRINAQLLDVRTGAVAWAQSYERDVKDVLALQDEVAAAIAREVAASAGARRLPSARAVRPEAYDAYLKGRFFWNKRTEAGLRKSIEYFNQAIEQDRTYAQAHAGLADAYALLGSLGYDAIAPAEAMPLAKAAVLRALALDDELAEAHTSLAYVLMSYDWDFTAAAREFRRAMELNPGYVTAHHWFAHYLIAAGDLNGALAEMKKARSLDPLSLPVNVGVGWCLYFARRYDEAIDQYRKALDLDPGFALGHQTLGMALLQKGASAEAITEFQKAAAISPSASAIASLGAAYAKAGSRAQALSQVERLDQFARERFVPGIYPCWVWLALGDVDRAAAWFAKARDQRAEYMIYSRFDPLLDPVRPDPRFSVALPAFPH